MSSQHKPYSSALGTICGIIVSVLYVMPLHDLTMDYFATQIGSLLHIFGYGLWWFIWLVILFIAIVVFMRCVIMVMVTLFTSLLIRLTLTRY